MSTYPLTETCIKVTNVNSNVYDKNVGMYQCLSSDYSHYIAIFDYFTYKTSAYYSKNNSITVSNLYSRPDDQYKLWANISKYSNSTQFYQHWAYHIIRSGVNDNFDYYVPTSNFSAFDYKCATTISMSLETMSYTPNMVYVTYSGTAKIGVDLADFYTIRRYIDTSIQTFTTLVGGSPNSYYYGNYQVMIYDINVSITSSRNYNKYTTIFTSPRGFATFTRTIFTMSATSVSYG